MKTLSGKECVALGADSEIGKAVIKGAQPRGSYQKLAVENLLNKGFIVSYLASGHPLRGNAQKYKGRYEESLVHVMRRLKLALPVEFDLRVGKCGQKGGYGFWVVKK